MNRLLIHLVFWFILLLWINPIFNINGLHEREFFLFNLVRLPLIATSTYLLIYYLLPRYLFHQQNNKKFGLAFICLFVVTNLLDRCLLGTGLVGNIMSDTNLTYTFFNEMPSIRNAFLLLAIMGIASVYPLIKRQRNLTLQLVEKNKNAPSLLDTGQSIINDGYFFLKSGKNTYKLKWSNILYLEKDENYVIYHTAKKKYLERITLKKVIQKAPLNFKRVHKSFVVSINNIDQIEGNHLTINERKIPIGRKFGRNFLDSLFK